ncbi:MAG: leucine-rich repeat domain-containing protein [Planctomycetes bacterium]|nr:leucine-rich repeat domain-containing protein [Planctomycetota bacterium]
MRKLRTLDLSGTDVTDRGLECLSGLVNLESLNLSGTEVTDRGTHHLKGLRKLNWLNLQNTAVTAAGLRRLQAALPACEILSSTAQAQR